MQTLSRILTGTLVAGTMAVTAAAPAFAAPYDRYYGGPGMGPRSAVDQCVTAAMRTADRYGGRARVTDIRDVDRKSYGYKVEGHIAVNARDWRDGWGGRSYDSGRFACKVDYRRGVFDLTFSGVRGL